MRKTVSIFLFSVALFPLSVIAQTPTQPPDAPPSTSTNSIWIEAESPHRSNLPPIAPSSPKPSVLSGGQWLQFAAEKDASPATGVTLSYTITAPSATNYIPYIRLGFEWVRSDLEIRVGDGSWIKISATQPTTNVVEVGTWTEVAWVKAPAIALPAGPSRIDLRFTRPEKSDRLIFALDCFALVPDGTGFIPDNTLRPGQTYADPLDLTAASHAYTITPSPSPGEHATTPLSGTWQVARWDDPDMDTATYEPLATLPPDDQLHFRAISVPADAWAARPDLSFAHGLIYRTRLTLPPNAPTSGYLLRFGGHAWITSVFIDGKPVGSHTGVMVPFDVDLSPYLKPGSTHTLSVAIKGSYYAIDHAPGQLKRSRNQPRTEEFLKYLKWVDATWPTGKGGGDSIHTGITRPPSLIAVGRVYTSDTFIRAFVNDKRLTAEIELTNPTDTPQTVTVRGQAIGDASREVELTLPDATVTIPPESTANLTLNAPFPNAKLWWPSESLTDKPYCYQFRTTLLQNDKPLDIRNDLFGFRELGVDGRHVTINGVPWRPHTWNSIGNGTSPNALDNYFSWNDRGVRMEGGLHAEFFDRNGIPGRLSMCFEGMFGQVAMNNPITWDNWKRHTRQMVRAYRNSPSVIHWSVGNEVMMITGRLFFSGDIAKHEKLLAEVFAEARKLDPTRTISEDGAGDAGALGDSNNWHYVTGEFKIPREFFAYDIGPERQQRDTQNMGILYRWDGNRPLIQGEEFYFDGSGNFAWFGGPKVYRGKPFRDLAGGKYGRIFIEGARWQDVFLSNPCTGPLPGIQTAMAARAVFVREYNSAFAPGSTLLRTLKVFNDTRTAQTLTLKWRIDLAGKTVASGEKPYTLPAGGNQQDTLSAALPAATERLNGQLILELFAGNEKVFSDTKPLSVLPPGTAAAFTADQLAVFDPASVLKPFLTELRQPHTPLAGPATIPASARAVLIAPNAITPDNRESLAAALRAFVTSGKIAIVLEQSVPLRDADFPTPGIVLADRERGKAARPEWEKVGGHTGAIAHPMALAHPLLLSLTPDDFFTWASDDQLSYRLSYATPPSGTINLLQAGEDLSLTPAFELLVGRGSYLLSQLLIGEKIATEPVARRLLTNALHYAASRADARATHTRIYAPGNSAFSQAIAALGIADTPADSVQSLLASDTDVAVVDATPANLQLLTQRNSDLQSFTSRGGWLLLAGLTPDGLADFQTLTGTPTRIRPFVKESVRIENPDHPLAMGISDRDVQQIDPEVIAPWIGLHRVSGKVFTSVVDADDNLAPFAALPNFKEGTDRPLTDGLTGDTFWRYVQYLASDGSETVTFTLDRKEKLSAIRVFSSGAYHWIKDLEVSLDDAAPFTFTLKNATGPQTLDLPSSRAVGKVNLRIRSTYPVGPQVSQPLVTLDEIQLLRAPAESPAAIPLTSPAGIVAYPQGKGGIVLCQLALDPTDLPDNAAKKKLIYSALLRNLGSTFDY